MEASLKWMNYIIAIQQNKLTRVSDAATGSFAAEGFKDGGNLTEEYKYDLNGNMIIDVNKGIEGSGGSDGIAYNYLNLPTKVYVNGSHITYHYDATGVKIKKTVSTGGTTEYAGNYIYENSNLEFFSTPEGYVEPDGSGYNYVYQYKDHLGNIRLSYMANDTSEGGVLLNQDFSVDTENWEKNTQATISNNGQKLNVTTYSIDKAWYTLDVTPGETLTVEF